MRRIMLSTLALVALALPATAQERICREPNRIANEFANKFLSEGTSETNNLRTVQPRANEIFDRAFKEHCKAGDVINLTPAFQSFIMTHCDLSRPSHQVGNTVICFAQVPPRE